GLPERCESEMVQDSVYHADDPRITRPRQQTQMKPAIEIEEATEVRSARRIGTGIHELAEVRDVGAAEPARKTPHHRNLDECPQLERRVQVLSRVLNDAE